MSATDRDLQLADVFIALADTLRPGYDVIDTMDLLVDAATRYTSAVEAGIVLADADGRLHVIASTSERATDIEEAQLGTHQGPCLESFSTGRPIEVPDISDVAQRWPEFARIATERGFRAAHATPLTLRERTIGAINLFSTRTGPLDDRDTALAQALAQIATIGIINQQTAHGQATLNTQLQQALDSRILIEQAKGFLAARHDISIDAAFTRLRNHARHHQSRLRDTAEHVLQQREL